MCGKGGVILIFLFFYNERLTVISSLYRCVMFYKSSLRVFSTGDRVETPTRDRDSFLVEFRPDPRREKKLIYNLLEIQCVVKMCLC